MKKYKKDFLLALYFAVIMAIFWKFVSESLVVGIFGFLIFAYIRYED